MKTTIAYLGILATMFVNTTVANGIAREDQNFDQVATESNLDSGAVTFKVTLKKQEVNSESEIIFTDIVINTSSNIAIEEVIEEDKKITEFQHEDSQPLTGNRKMEEVIKEDNQIIESTSTNEVYPLDFELIKKYENALKSEAFKMEAFDKTSIKS